MKCTVKELFKFHSGSGALTERAIYNSKPETLEDMVTVYSGATDDQNNLPICSKSLVAEVCAPMVCGYGILVARKGQAGSMRLVNGMFTLNDNAYVLTPKNGAIDSIDPLFFTIAYQEAFFNLVTSKDGNGTFSKGVAENLTIWVPPIERQRNIVKAWRKQEIIKGKLVSLLDQVQDLMNRPTEAQHEMKIKVGALVSHFQGRQITDKELYEAAGTIPVISGASAEIKGYSSTPLVTIDELPCITYQTKGNTEVLLHLQNQIFDANNTAVMSVKKAMRSVIDTSFLMMPLRWKMLDIQTSSESVSYIDTRILSSEIPVPVDASGKPDIDEQRRIVSQYQKLQDIAEKLRKLIEGSSAAQNRLRQLAISLASESHMQHD